MSVLLQDEFQNSFRATCDRINTQLVHSQVICSTANELFIETNNALADDNLYVTVAVLMMLCYVSIVLARFDLVDSRCEPPPSPVCPSALASSPVCPVT